MTDSQPPPHGGRHRVPAAAAPVQPPLLVARWRLLGWLGMASMATFVIMFVAALTLDSDEHPVASVLLGAGALLAVFGAAVSMFSAAYFARRPTPPGQP